MIMEIPEFKITLHEVLGGNKPDLAELLAIHRDLFPQYAYYHPYMSERAQTPPLASDGSIDHWWLMRLKGTAVAINLFKTIPQRRCGIILALAVQPAYRALAFGPYQRLAEFLLMKSIEQVQADLANHADAPPLGVVAEAEDYLCQRYEQYNFVRLPVDYAEPAFPNSVQTTLASPSAEMTFHPLNLFFYPFQQDLDRSDPTVLKEVIYALLVDYYELPETHEFVKQTLASITSPDKGNQR